ncbi:Protein disulfide-isomerase A4, partial [Armadillidium nasatum]
SYFRTSQKMIFKKFHIKYLIIHLHILTKLNEVLCSEDSGYFRLVNSKSIFIFLLVEIFFALNRCGHCKALEPEYAAAAKKLKKDGIRIAKVDATVENDLAKEFDIKGFPTIKLFREGEVAEEYDGSRTSTDIIEYMRKHADPNYVPPPSSVKVLETSNFSDFVKSEKLSLVEFYAPWCGHCKELAPQYEAAAEDLKNFNIPLAKVDAVAETSFSKRIRCQRLSEVIGVFRYGRSYEYKGPRDSRGIVSYMEEQSKLPSIKTTSLLQAKNQIPRTDPCVFSFFENENKFFEDYISAANHMRGENVYLHTFDKEVASKYDLSQNSINILFPEIYHSKYETKKKTFSKMDEGEKGIITWISDNVIPLVGHRTRTNIATKYSKRPLVVVYYDVNFTHQYVKATQIVRKKIVPVANKFKDLTFAISNEEEFEDELKNFGLDDSGEDINVGIFGEGNLRYRMEPEEDFESDDLEEFVSKFVKGKLKPHLKSQAVPKKQEGPVRTIVASTFEDEVLKNKKDVLIEFYAPWCGHCKKIEPVYKKVAAHYSSKRPDLLIAKMDATSNDVLPMFDVRGFPTIYLLKASDKSNPIIFDGGDRTLKGFKDFIEKHLSSKEEKDEL